ncbi:MAG: glycoside hydrolase family 44 protein [Anaerolineae bacterium]
MQIKKLQQLGTGAISSLLIVAGLLVLLIMAPVAAQDSDLSVDASQSLGTISPYVYGANMGAYSIVPQDMMPQAQALNLKYLRFGGTDSDQADVVVSQFDIFILKSRMLGTEPALTVRLLHGTPEKAAEVVRYINIEKGYNVQFWSIGNEPNFFEDVIKEPSYNAEDLAKNWREIAEAMKAVDPTIKFVGPDVSQYVPLSIDGDKITYLEPSGGGDPRDKQGNDWMQTFLRANGDLLDVVAIHRYPYPGGNPNNKSTIDGLRANSREWDTIIPTLRQVIREAAGRDIPLAITEFNSDSRQSSNTDAALDSFYNAIWTADVLGRFIRQQVYIAAFWDIQGGADRSWGLLSKYDVRPVYYSYLLYTHLGSELLASSSADEDVTITAARRDDGALTLMVINLGPDEVTKTLDLTGITPAGEAEVWRFDAEHKAEQIESVDVSAGLTLPGQSATMYIIPAGQ